MNNFKISKQIATSASVSLAHSTEKSMNTVSDKTKEFIKQLSNSTTEVIEKCLKLMTDEINIRNKNIKLYKYENCILLRANGRNSYNIEQNLDLCKQYGIAPDFVKYFQLGKDDFLTVMEVGDNKIIPYTSVADKISKETKLNFENSVRRFYQNNNAVNQELFSNKDALFITNDGKRIIFADWNELHYLSNTEKQNMSEFITKWHI